MKTIYLSKCDVSNEKLFFAKNDLRNLAYSSFNIYNKIYHKFENPTQGEHRSFLELIKLVNIFIQKEDKGNVIVLRNKNDYVGKMETILHDSSKF